MKETLSVGGMLLVKTHGRQQFAHSNTARQTRHVAQHLLFIEPRQLVALVGRSGSGKTRLTYLLARLYDGGNKLITIDGHTIKQTSLLWLANSMGVVTQERYLFHTSATRCAFRRAAEGYAMTSRS